MKKSTSVSGRRAHQQESIGQELFVSSMVFLPSDLTTTREEEQIELVASPQINSLTIFTNLKLTSSKLRTLRLSRVVLPNKMGTMKKL